MAFGVDKPFVMKIAYAIFPPSLRFAQAGLATQKSVRRPNEDYSRTEKNGDTALTHKFVTTLAFSMISLISLGCGASGPGDQEKVGPTQDEMLKAMEVMEDNGVVIMSPGEEPELIAIAGHLAFRALGGHVEFFHPVEDGIPLPAESDSAVAYFAGPGAIPVEGDLLLAWKVEIRARTDVSQLNRFNRILVEDITGDSPILIADTSPDRTGGNLTVVTAGDSLTPETYPWVFTTEPNLIVLRISLMSDLGAPEVLLQPVVIQPVFKQQAQQMFGIIHG